MSAPPDNLARLRAILACCTLCPRNCRVNRLAGQVGSCRIGADAVVASAGPHFGEEPALVGCGGSGTIFLAGCNLHCAFCQNADISQTADGQPVSPAQLARVARRLQDVGCQNVNFVTPTHVAHAVAEAVWTARRQGLTVPVVYNCGGYEAVPTLRLLEGLIEIYMPDFKYADGEAAAKYSDAPDYPAVATAALAEMYRQVGPLELDDHGVALRGVLVRHLVMPNDLAGSEKVIDIVAEAAPGCTINVMAQYRPAYRAGEFPELMSRPPAAEIARLREHAAERGLALTS